VRAERKRNTPRELLLAAIVDVTAEHGYEGATIAHVTARAGLPRPTFYAHFSGKEEGFLAALAEIEKRLLATAARSIRQHPPKHAAAAVVAALVSFAETQPAQARLLMNETLAAGPRARDARDRGIAKIAELIEGAYRGLPARTVIPDVPVDALLGAIHRLLASRLRRGERGLVLRQRDLLQWVASYGRPAGEHRWRTLAPGPTDGRSAFMARAPLRAPPPMGPGGPRRSTSTVAENQRLRIIFATAEVVQANGYLDASVTRITGAANVGGRAFYELFADKQDAFMAVQELAFQSAMAVTAGAFFAAEDWPQRIWEAGRACTQHLEQNPTLAHAFVVESHAGGPEAVERFENLLAGFTIFLQEGYQYTTRRTAPAPSGLALQAIAAANLELLYRQARSRGTGAMTGTLAHLTYTCLAPFIGSPRSSELVEALINGDGPLRGSEHRRAWP
jgi:AcrR family transcriptional regulator